MHLLKFLGVLCCSLFNPMMALIFCPSEMFSFHSEEHMPMEHVCKTWGKDDPCYAPCSFIFSPCCVDSYLYSQCEDSTSRFHFSQHTPYLSNRTAQNVALQTGRSDVSGCWLPESQGAGDEMLWNWQVVRGDYCPAKQDVKKPSQLFARWQTSWKYSVWNGHSHSHSYI